MTHKRLATTITIVTAFILCWQTSLADDLFLFVLAGIIPGTERSLSPTTMLTLIWSVAVLLALSSRQVRALARRLFGSLRAAFLTLDTLLKHRLGQY